MTSSERWRRIEEIFTSALELPPGQRAPYLEFACGGDTALREEVDALLARDDEGFVLAGIIEGTAASLLDEDAPADAMVGAQFGNYRIIRELGRGGMGAVYLAVRADSTFDKQVAIKLVKRGIDTDAVLRRFWYERRILAGLEHPYIARLVDGGTSPDGRPYFVMEYVDGQPLDSYVREKGLTIAERCELFRKVCDAVSYAHRNLIIHRDLKPANIQVTSDGTPKLLDFGIARLLSVDPDEHTIAGTSAGHAWTPEYGSPEQQRGEAVTTATDVYSLGATLTAILPTDSPLPADLITILRKAMRDEIDQRYASVADLSEDMRRFLCGLPIAAREQTLLYRAGKFVRRHRVGVGVFALFNVLVFAGIGGILWESHRVEIQRREAEQRLSQAVAMADKTLSEVSTSIAALPGTTEARRQIVRNTLDYLDRLARDSGNDPRVLIALATAYIRVSEVLGNPDFTNLGDLSGAIATYRKALDIINGLPQPSRGSIKVMSLECAAHQGLAAVLGARGRSGDARSEDRLAIALADRALAQSPDNLELQYQSLDAHYALGMLSYTASPEETDADARRELPIAERLAAAGPANLEIQSKLSDYYSLLGTTASRLSGYKTSLVYYKKSVDVREAIYRQRPRDPSVQRNLMIAYGHVGDMLGNPFIGCMGEYSEGLVYYQKAADIADEMHRADPSDKRASSDVGMIWARIGAARHGAGDLRGSNQALDRSIAQFEPMIAASPGNAGYARGIDVAYEYRARNAWLLGDREAAIVWYRKAVTMANRLVTANPHDPVALVEEASSKGPLGALLALTGDRAGAVKMLDEAVKAAGQLKAINVARAMMWKGEGYQALRDYETAAQAYEESLQCWKMVPDVLNTAPHKDHVKEVEQGLAECRKHLARKPPQP